jgi:hypothetical protein
VQSTGVPQVFIALGLVIAAVAIATVLNRRRVQPPTQGKVPVPVQLDRGDFPGAERPWLVVVWTSKTCASCQRATDKARLLESDQVAYAEVPWQDRRDLHDRYGVEDVPLIVLADGDGVVRASFVGTPEFAELAGAMASVRGLHGGL